jgi:hypothetical protein
MRSLGGMRGTSTIGGDLEARCEGAGIGFVPWFPLADRGRSAA